MPSLKEIKGRIASVNSTRKITSAMKMVASSKLHHAQVAIQNMLPYESMLEHILKSFLAAEAEAQTIFDKPRPVKRAALVVFTSNSSLCGGFNANTIKLMAHIVDEYAQTIGRENVEIYPIGRKVYEKAQKMGLNVQGEYSALADKPNVAQCIDIAMELSIITLRAQARRYSLVRPSSPSMSRRSCRPTTSATLPAYLPRRSRRSISRREVRGRRKEERRKK